MGIYVIVADQLDDMSINCSYVTFFKGPVTRTKKIFVGGVSATTTESDIRQFFENFGKVSFLKFIVVW